MNRKFLTLSLLILSVSCATTMSAQEEKKPSFFRDVAYAIDSILLERRSKIITDTNYVVRPKQAWTFKLYQNLKGDYMELFSQEDEDQKFNYYLQDQGSTSTGISASFRGLTLSYAINPNRLSGKDQNKELGFTIFNRRYGVDFSSFSTKHYTGTLQGSETEDEYTNATMNGVSIHGYYVFNGRKFSYPAAFTGSWIQRRSAGSFIVGATYFSSKYLSGIDQEQADEIIGNYYDEDECIDNLFLLQESIKFKYFSLGIGYAYNFVPNRHWLIHASILPSLIPWRRLESCNEIWRYKDALSEEECQAYRSEYSDYLSYDATSKFFNFTNVTRLSITYSWKNCFLGLNANAFTGFINCSTDGDTSFLSNTRWKIKCYFGIRL